MVIRNVTLVRAENMEKSQREELGIGVTEGLVAIETHNTEYKQVARVIGKGEVMDYIWGDETN